MKTETTMNDLAIIKKTFFALFLSCFFLAAKEIAPPKTGCPRIAILYFENNSSNHAADLAPLAKGLCDMMIGDMKASNCINVIERTRLEEVMKELKITRKKAFDKKTTQKLGKLLGVQYLVLGSYFDLLGKFRVDARIVKVETGEIVAATGITGRSDDFDLIEQQLVAKLLDKLLTHAADTHQAKQDSPSEKRRQLTLRGAVAYGQALDMSDAGNKQGAAALLKDIVEQNPDFALAAQMLADFEK